MTVRLDAIGVVAPDLARSLAFYRLLGVDLPPDADQSPHVEASLPGGLRMMWDTPEVITSFDPDWSMPTGTGHSFSIAFACADSAEVDATYAAVINAGFVGHLPPWDAFWGQRYASLRDPDGNVVDLFAPLPTP